MRKSFQIITIGCQMNKSDSERVANYLSEQGFNFSEEAAGADYVVVNTCGVRQSAEDRVYGIIPKIKKQHPKTKVILTGCLSGRDDVRKRLKDKVDIWMPITDLPNLIRLIGGKDAKKNLPTSYLKIKAQHNSSISAFVPIGNGCDNFCAYCVVPYTRGREVYRPAREIIKEIGELINQGYKEIILIAQNVNSYKSEASGKVANFAQLLKVLNDIPGDFWLRFATSHPKDMSRELIKVMAEGKKICKHLHLPVQSGDNSVLKKMNRQYTRSRYIKLVSKIREQIPDISITTDIIVGFPGETKIKFNNTARLFREVKFDMAYIAKYSPRPKTAAALLPNDVSRGEKKKREEELMTILRETALSNNRKYLNKKVKVLVESKGKQENEWAGRSSANKAVKITSFCKKNLLGKFIEARIKKARDFGLAGEYVR